MQSIVTSKKVYTQAGPVEAHVGHRYHVVVRHTQFGDYDFDGTLEAIQSLDPNPLGETSQRVFDFLHFGDVADVAGGGRGARDFTIASLREIS